MGKSTKYLLALVSVITLFAFTLPVISSAVDVPQTLNYQGNLTDNVGQPVTGSHQIVFKLYNALSGGTYFWTETQTVQVEKGRFSVALGKTTPIDAAQFTGDTYIGIKVDTGAEMVPRQQFTSVAYALKAGSLFNMPSSIPTGGIIMWSGATNEIPAGWALCDGQNGTPDLRDKFVLGAGTTYAVGDHAGSPTKDLSHIHSTGDHILTIPEMPGHTHPQDAHGHPGTFASNTHAHSRIAGSTGWTTGGSPMSGPDSTASVSATTATNQNTGGGAAHNHGNTTLGGSTAQDIMPPYYALALIMKL